MKKKVLTEKEYFKYNSNDVYDALDRPLKIGDVVVVNNMSEIRIGKNRSILKLIVRDETGTATITWFNQKYLK